MLAHLTANLVTTYTPHTPCTNKPKSDDIAKDPDARPETPMLKALHVCESLDADTMAALTKAFAQTLPTSSLQAQGSPYMCVVDVEDDNAEAKDEDEDKIGVQNGNSPQETMHQVQTLRVSWGFTFYAGFTLC